MKTTQIRKAGSHHARRLTRALARNRRLQLVLAMIVGLVIGMASMGFVADATDQVQTTRFPPRCRASTNSVRAMAMTRPVATGRATAHRAEHPFPAVHDYDEAVPTDLLVRWTGLDTDRLVLADLGRYLATCAGIAVSGIGLAAMVFGSIGIAPSVAVTVAGLLVAAASMLVGRRLRRRTGLRGRDIDLVLAHRSEIRFESWNQLAERRPVHAWPEEAQLAHRAGRACMAVQGTAIWSESDQLDHRLRLDTREASRQIHVAAWQIHTLRGQLGSRPADAVAAPVAAEWDAATAQLDRSLAVLRREVEGIEGYRCSVEQADQLMLVERRRVALQDLTEQAGQRLSAQDARHELATDHLSGLHRDLGTPDDVPAGHEVPRG